MFDDVSKFVYLIIFYFTFWNKTALHIAIQKENIEIVELLLAMPNIDINFPLVLNQKNVFYIV